MGQIVRLADPQISPDAKSIAAIVSLANFEESRYDAQLLLIDTASKSQRVLVRDRRGISSPRWSPDGKRLAFLATVEGRSQVFALPMDRATHLRPQGRAAVLLESGRVAPRLCHRRRSPQQPVPNAITRPSKWATTTFSSPPLNSPRTSGSLPPMAWASPGASPLAPGPFPKACPPARPPPPSTGRRTPSPSSL